MPVKPTRLMRFNLVGAAAALLYRWWPQRLSTRLVLLFLGVLLVVQLAGLTVVQWSISRNAREQLQQDLQVGEHVWSRLLVQRAARLTLGASALAADYGLRAAAASGDTEALNSALENHGQRIGATVVALFSSDLQPRAVVTHAAAAAVTAAGQSAQAQPAVNNAGAAQAALETLRPLAPRLAERGSLLALLGDQPFQLVMVPMKAPQLMGYVAMGFPLDQSLVDDMEAVAGLHAALLLRNAAGTEKVALSSLPRKRDADLLARPEGNQLTIAGGDPHVFLNIPQIGDGSPGTAGLRTLLLRSLDDAVAPYQSLKATLAALTLLGMVLAGAASVFIARQMTVPLGQLVRATETLGRGDFSRALKHAGRADEIGDLSRAFEQMRVSVSAHEQAIRRLAYWDGLTGLPNRAQFRDAVRQAIDNASTGRDDQGNERPPRPVSVVMLDLDRFKHVNDVLGFAFGDRLLKGVAERLLRMSVREGDVVARLSGDEFAILLPGSDAAAAVAVAERIADVFQLPMTMDDHTVDLAAGFGVSCWPAHAADADALINRAEVAMYNAKRKSGAPQVYDPRIDASSARSLSMLSELRRALENDELRLFLQPKIALQDGRFTGAEALVRWQHPQRGMVPPLEFIPFAEQTGFVRHLTLWMIEATARQWAGPAGLAALGLSSVSVNLSTRDLLDAELPMKIARILRRCGMPAPAMCLEITESAIMDEPQRALATLNMLSAAGFKLSIDDFGTGYSSLAYLKRLPVNELKIDRSFVMAMENDIDDAKIVRSTVDLAHNLGLTVVAEGVENLAVLRLLAELGCDEAQGYHMSRPLPAAEMAAFASKWQTRSEDVAAAWAPP